MQVHCAYIGCTKEEQEELQRCWEERQQRFYARAEAMQDEPASLQGVASQHEEPPRWRLHSALYLPGRTLVVEESRDDPCEAIDAVISRLVEEADRLEDRPEKATLRREGLHGIVPLLERCRREGRSDIFFAWLTPLMGSLAAHIRRELRLREQEGDIPPGRTDPSDILDETLLRAHQEFDRRPAKRPLDLWLLQLADEAIDRSSQELAEVSLDDRVARPTEEPRESQRDSWVEWATVSDTVELADLLPDIPSADRWDSLDMEARQAETEKLLARLPRIQRQALVLHTVYGFSSSEVADFQNRPESEVLYEINEARRTLEQAFREEYLAVAEEQLERR